MTEAVAYAPIALAKKAFTLVWSQKKLLIYLYDGPMVGLSSQAAVGSTVGSTKTCIGLYGTKLRHPDYTTIVEVDKSLFWLQTSVQTFLTNAIEGI